MKVETIRLPTTNVLVQSFNFQINTPIQHKGGFGRFMNATHNWKLKCRCVKSM